MGGQNSKTVNATVNSFTILESLIDADGPLGVTELADAVGLSKGVVHNHLSTLSELGYVRRQKQKYRPSLGLLTLGERTRENLRLYNVARAHVDNLAQATGEATTLFVEEDGVGICVYLAHSSREWQPDYVCGQRIPLHVNAPGKAILSSLDRERVDSILEDGGLTRLTNETLTIGDSLRSELRNIRVNGVAFCREEQFEGIVGVAAPISLDARGPAAAVGVCGPIDRLTGRYLEEDITGQVISTAKSIQVGLTQ